MGEEAKGDLLLRNYADEIQKNAILILYEAQCKIFKTISIK